jgi:hypothetical protein
MLITNNRAEILRNCRVLKNYYSSENEAFLAHVVTRDEILSLSQRDKAWSGNTPGSPARKKFKTRPAVGMVMLMFFGDMGGYIYYLEGQKTINSQYKEQNKACITPQVSHISNRRCHSAA